MPCVVRTIGPAWVIKFHDGRSLIMNSADDRSEFATRCGYRNFDQLDFDPGDITACPDDYLEIAEFDGETLDRFSERETR